jgi:hypothetical protein
MDREGENPMKKRFPERTDTKATSLEDPPKHREKRITEGTDIINFSPEAAFQVPGSSPLTQKRNTIVARTYKKPRSMEICNQERKE